MSRVIVDTSVVSFLLKQHSLAPAYEDLLRGSLVGLSFMSLAELRRWPLDRKWGARRIAAMEEHLVGCILLFPDEETCRQWARVVSSSNRKGRPISVADAWIAATALHHRCPLVTHNPRHFQYVDDLTVLTIPG